MAVAGKFETVRIDAQDWALRRLDRFRRRFEPAHLAVGLRGERAALFELRRRGYVIVARRWTSTRMRGDIDLVGWDGRCLCFIEVKTRTTRGLAPAEFAVDDHKRKMVRALARAYLRSFSEKDRRTIAVRFDVVSVYPGEESCQFEIFPGAFTWE